MKYAPIIKRIDEIFAESAIGHIFLFKLLEVILPRTWHIKRELKQWAALHPKHNHILDAGSGLGQYSYLLTRMNRNWSIVGNDVNENLIGHCNEVFRKLHLQNVVFKTCDLQCPTTAESYDLVLATDLAEYVEDDMKVFKNLHHILKFGGSMILYTHLIDELNPLVKRARLKLVDEQYRNGYTPNEIRDKLRDAGFQKVKIRYVFGALGTLSWKLSILFPMKMLNFNFLLTGILPIYYLMILPFVIILNYIDSHTGHLRGTAMLVKAWKI